MMKMAKENWLEEMEGKYNFLLLLSICLFTYLVANSRRSSNEALEVIFKAMGTPTPAAAARKRTVAIIHQWRDVNSSPPGRKESSDYYGRHILSHSGLVRNSCR